MDKILEKKRELSNIEMKHATPGENINPRGAEAQAIIGGGKKPAKKP